MASNALSTAGRFRFVASDRTGRPWTTLTARSWCPHFGVRFNQVERWFATLTEKYIRRGTHRSTRELEQAIKQYLIINNANPKPFAWSKSADDILASIERFCLRISNSGH